MADIYHVVSQRLKQCRKELGLTVKQTIASTTIKSSTYSNWEQGIRKPKPEAIFQLAKVFDINPAYLSGLTDVKERPIEADALGEIHVIEANGRKVTLDENQLKLTREFYHKKREVDLSNDSCFPWIMLDDSMLPTIEEGDEIVIDRRHTKVTKSDIYALISNDQIWIRWIEPKFEDNYIMRAANGNQHGPRWADKELSQEELDKLAIVGRVSRISRDR